MLRDEDDIQIYGWAKPVDAQRFHFFTDAEAGVMLESVCRDFYTVPWFVTDDAPLDAERDPNAEGNCVGCRAWLLIPSNRRKIPGLVKA